MQFYSHQPSGSTPSPSLAHKLAGFPQQDWTRQHLAYGPAGGLYQPPGAPSHAHSHSLGGQHALHSPAAIQQGNTLGAPTPPTVGNGVGPHWQQQLVKAEVARASSSPHHRARAAALAQRGTTNSAIAILDPNSKTPTNRTATPKPLINGNHKNTASNLSASPPPTPSAHPSSTSAPDRTSSGPAQGWHSIDMGGMQLKTLSPSLFSYAFLTNLFINHNNLTSLPPDISRLTNLVLLDASGNGLSVLPPELGMLTHLRELLLFDNNLVTLPPELGTLHQLEFLGIDGNPLAESLRSVIQKDGTAALIAYLRDSCPVPLPPPEREWVAIEPDVLAPKEGDPPAETFSMLCYNILCDKYATSHMYGYTPSWALAWDYRKELILQEIMSYGADILCLQEVDIEQYEDYFLHHLSQQDYEGVYSQKSRAKTMSETERKRVDGCATFYKVSKYKLIENQVVEFNQIAMQRPDFQKSDDMFNRVMTKDNIANVALLENRDSGSRLIVANVHIHWNPEFRDVKLVQVAMLMDEIEKIANRFALLPPKLDLAPGFPRAPVYSDGSKIPTLICGDFNSVPSSGVYEFLSKGTVMRDHEDFMDHVYGNYTSDGMGHRLPLRSAYANIGELPMTNYTPGFEGVIDYIWYTTNSVSVTGLLGEVDPSYLSKVVGFPNAHFPSDHVCLLSEFRLRPPSAAASPATRIGF